MNPKWIAGLMLALVLLATGSVAAQAQADQNIVEIAAANEDFSTLVTAVQAAGLADALAGEGPFTVFAPTNAAFAALPAGTLDALLADPTGDLTQILLYHVVPGKVMAADVADGLEVETLQGGTVTFTVADGKVMINDAEIVMTDIEASNGVIHVIDAVILPSAEAPATMPTTGADLGGLGINVLVVTLAAASLAGGEWMRRRLAVVRIRK